MQETPISPNAMMPNDRNPSNFSFKGTYFIINSKFIAFNKVIEEIPEESESSFLPICDMQNTGEIISCSELKSMISDINFKINEKVMKIVLN